MGKTTTFNGRVRSRNGGKVSNSVTPTVTTHAVIISFTAPASSKAVRVGYSGATTLPALVLPKGAIIQHLSTLVPLSGGASPTLNFGMSGDADEFYLNYDADAAATSQKDVIPTGADHIAARYAGGLAADTAVLVEPGTGTPADTGTFVGLLEYFVYDDGKTESAV